MSWWQSLLEETSGRSRQASSAGADVRGGDWLGFRPAAARPKRILLEPGETHVMADVDGPGMINRIWMTSIAASPFPALRDVVLRFFWDDETHPSVECSFGDFFGASFGRFRSYVSAPLSFTSGGFNCRFPMPFATGARLELENQGGHRIDPFFYAIGYYELEKPPRTDLRFHAQWARENPTTDGSPYTILEAEGRGHYVGARLDIQNREQWLGRPLPQMVFPFGMGFGMLEGQERIWVDDDDSPSILGTGTEDYFNAGWYFAPGKFSAPTHGCTVRSWLTGRVSAYRFDVDAPIPFRKQIRVTIDHGIENSISGDYSSVAYWYQAEPHRSMPPLPPPDERRPTPIWQNLAQSSVVLAPIGAIAAVVLARRFRREA